MSLLDSLNTFSVDEFGNTVEKSTATKLIERIEQRGYDISEMEGVIRTPGNKLILACAGSGKTTSLGFAVLFDLESGELTNNIETPTGDIQRIGAKVLVSTFLKSGAEDINRSLYQLKRDFQVNADISNVRCSTLHSEFKSVLDLLGLSKDIIDEKSNTSLLGKVLRDKFNLFLNSEELRNMVSALSFTRNVLKDNRYSPEIYTEHNLSAPTIDLILQAWGTARDDKGVMDYDDIQDKLYTILYKESDTSLATKLRTYLQRKYDAIYLDEFQDISDIQYELIKVYASGDNFKKIVAIGDDDQTIYTWRGSSHDIITKRFGTDFKANVQTLTKNRRTPSVVLDSVVPSINKNTNRYPKSITSAREGGVLRYGRFNTLNQMAVALNDIITACISHNRTVAVMCRTNMEGMYPAFTLERSNTPARFKINSDAMTLDSYIGKQIMSIASLVSGRGTAETERAIRQLCSYRNRNEATLLVEGASSLKETIWALSEDDIKYSAPYFYTTHYKQLKEVRDNLGDNKKFFIYLLEYFTTNVYTKDNDFHMNARGILDTLKILALAPESEPDFGDFIYDLKELNNQLKARKSLNPSNVNSYIATVHEFKGKEVDDVIIWNASDDSFPHKKAGDIEEERRLWYIACTRARKSLHILAPKDNPSRFLNEMDLSKATKIQLKVNLKAGK